MRMKTFWNTLPKPFLALAPMAGVTDGAFRSLCKEYGADVVYTEFVSVDAIVHENKKTMDMLRFDEFEQPVVMQLFGKNPEHFEHAARIVSRLGVAGIDINFGCPAYKVVKNGGGVHLMRTPELCAEILSATKHGAGSTPVSIKCRSSIQSEDKTRTYTALDLIRAMRADMPNAIMLHARTYEQPFDGEPQHGMYEAVREMYNGVLIANGGINAPEDAKKLIDEYGAHFDGIGIARGAMGKPWIFDQIKSYLKTGSYAEPTWEQKKKVILKHAKLALAHKDKHGLIELRKHLAWYVSGIPNASALRQELVCIERIDEIERILNKKADR